MFLAPQRQSLWTFSQKWTGGFTPLFSKVDNELKS